MPSFAAPSTTMSPTPENSPSSASATAAEKSSTTPAITASSVVSFSASPSASTAKAVTNGSLNSTSATEPNATTAEQTSLSLDVAPCIRTVEDIDNMFSTFDNLALRDRFCNNSPLSSPVASDPELRSKPKRMTAAEIIEEIKSELRMLNREFANLAVALAKLDYKVNLKVHPKPKTEGAEAAETQGSSDQQAETTEEEVEGDRTIEEQMLELLGIERMPRGPTNHE